jgi:hypothetical protein
MTASDHPYYVCDSRSGEKEGYSTLDQARESLLAWVLLQRQAGEPMIEHEQGQWSDSRVTRWIVNCEGDVIPTNAEAP